MHASSYGNLNLSIGMTDMGRVLVRHPDNKNLHLYYGTFFQDYPVMVNHAPFIAEYLEEFTSLIHRAFRDHRRIFAMRFDLRFPRDADTLEFDRSVVSRFVDSLTWRLRSARDRARATNPKAHKTMVHWCWVRERGIDGGAHYHFVLMLNNDSYHSTGRFASAANNVFNRIQAAWASALRLDVEKVRGLVYIPRNSEFHLTMADQVELDRFFRRSSYLFKAATKEYGRGGRSFGTSR
ncbi:inovirus-type Gp2 protein [Pseudomonas sp. W2-17]|uniref:YagK/YfjJ domain-containing protein n=1 Tax=Pseudomonas sp. W2-17 TaxID=3058039 RepID=UPI0034E0BF69